jgi:asparagine synthase (glutamine-hydrolysing)
MANETGEVIVTYNGEIYNHAELRHELEQRGHVFQSDHSDTEVVVHGYEEWGEALPARLNGMFAFAVYDKPRRRLFLARDRFGEKPLYYACRPALFAFASELGALMLHRSLERRTSVRSLQKLFAYGYIPAPRALYEGTYKLAPGHYLTFDLATSTFQVSAYWQFSIDVDGDADAPREEAVAEELGYLLSQSVRRRLISDVPLGIFLSGGIDSSAALVMAAQHQPAAGINTFTIGFQEPSFDETTYARQVANHIGSAHHEKQLDFALARELVPDVLSRLDEPIGDPSILPTYLLSRFTRQHVTVALSGDGGDELFGGYDPFSALLPARLYSRLVPRGLHKGVRRLSELLPISKGNMSMDFRLRRALAGLSYPSSGWNPVWMAPLEPTSVAELLDTPARFEDLYEESIKLWEASRGKSDIDRTLEFFTNIYLPNNILTKVDRASMMVSLETRAIFLDNDLVEFCRRLPNRFKIRNGERKYILKRALARHLPPHILGRRKKGFGIPLAKWLRSMPSQTRPRGLGGVNQLVLERWWGEHRSGLADHRLALWTSMSLEHSRVPLRSSANEHL